MEIPKAQLIRKYACGFSFFPSRLRMITPRKAKKPKTIPGTPYSQHKKTDRMENNNNKLVFNPLTFTGWAVL